MKSKKKTIIITFTVPETLIFYIRSKKSVLTWMMWRGEIEARLRSFIDFICLSNE